MRMYLRPPRLADADEIAAACARSEQARLLSRLGAKPSAPAVCAICLEETAAQGSTTLASPPPPSKAQTHSPLRVRRQAAEGAAATSSTPRLRPSFPRRVPVQGSEARAHVLSPLPLGPPLRPHRRRQAREVSSWLPPLPAPDFDGRDRWHRGGSGGGRGHGGGCSNQLHHEYSLRSESQPKLGLGSCRSFV